MDAYTSNARFRRRAARLQAVLFALAWLAAIAAPCAMAAHAVETGRDDRCPHCPPVPCHEVQPEDCSDDPLELPRPAESDPTPALADTGAAMLPDRTVSNLAAPAYRHPPGRAGPRLHLLQARFHE